MNIAFQRKDPGLGTVLVFSTILHAACYFLLSFSHFNLHPVDPEQVCYVDVVNLPVADPRAGSPASTGAGSAPPPPVAAPPEMKLPAPATRQTQQKNAPAQKSTASPSAESASEFEQRLANLERATEERRQAAALDALRQRVSTGSGRAGGMPKGTGTEAGSDYASYIQSRLYDAFKLPPNLQTKNPEVSVLLTINKAGRVAEFHIERSTGGKVFEDAVARAIANAERTFPPPPTKQNFVQKFVFTSSNVGTK